MKEIIEQGFRPENNNPTDFTIGLDVKKNKALDYLCKLDVLSQMEIFEMLSMRNLRDLLEVA